MENNQPIQQIQPVSTRRVIRISRKWFIVGIIALIIIAVVALKGNRYRDMVLGVSGGNSISSMEVPMMDFGGDYSTRYPYQNGSPDITDTREFLKVSYSAQIQTRDVEGVTRNVKNTVRDFDGRVDGFSSSEKYGYVSFVIPKDKLDEFRDEIESFTHKKLYTENISSQNLLGQKQVIEKNFASSSSMLSELEAQKKTLDANHNDAVNGKGGYKEQLATLAVRISAVRQQIAATDNSQEKARLQAEEAMLINEQTRTNQALAGENSTYASLSASLALRIADAKSNVNTVVKQDVQFGNNIETVNGSINVNWISYWQMAKLYSPIHPTIIVVVLVLLVLYFLNRKQYLPKIELV